MGNILNHNRDIFDININKEDYWDFHLSIKQGCSDNGYGNTVNCLSAYIDTTDADCVWFDDKLISKSEYTWKNSLNNGIELTNIGYTGVDNGLIFYEKDRINNKQFYELFTNSSYQIEKDDKRFYVSKIHGNNQLYDYDTEITDEDGFQVLKLNGGFYQGFYKLYGYEYQTLPSKLNDGWNIEMTLKREDFEDESNNKLNDVYPQNKGIFLYIGTRAENKWWLKYKVDEVFDKSPFVNDSEYVNDGYNDNDSLNADYSMPLPDIYEDGEYFADDYLSDEKNICCGDYYYFEETKPEKTEDNLIFRQPEYLSCYNENSLWKTINGGIWIENEQDTNHNNGIILENKKKRMKCNNCTDYFVKGYVDEEYYTNACDLCNQYATDEYIEKEMYIDVNENIKTSNGYEVSQPNIIEYKTDNKFITFNRTKEGFDINTWNDNNEVILYDVKVPKMENYFLLFDKTDNGYTTETINKLIQIKNKYYDVLKDLYRNALAFQITDDGKIGYKYMVKDCDSSTEKYKIESEFSATDVIHYKEWVVINIKIIPLQKSMTHNEKCFKNTNVFEKMKLFIYVNGKLVLISKELSMFNFKNLNDLVAKQESVPFNISIGGGTQGLCDMITLNYRETPRYTLPLEKEFGGSFIGFIKTFKFYDCPLNYNQILNNFNFETNLLKTINIYSIY